MPEQVSSQNNMARCDTRPAADPEWLLQVHPGLLEQPFQVLQPQLLPRGIHKRSEWHADSPREMTWQRVCEGETEEWHHFLGAL